MYEKKTKKLPQHWYDSHQKAFAFEKIKKIVEYYLIVAHPKLNEPFETYILTLVLSSGGPWATITQNNQQISLLFSRNIIYFQ